MSYLPFVLMDLSQGASYVTRQDWAQRLLVRCVKK